MTRRDLTLLVGGFAALLAVGWLVGVAITEADLVTKNVDKPVVEWLADSRTSFWNSFFRAVTSLGGGVLVAVVATAAAVLSFRAWRDPRAAGFILISVLVGSRIDTILKPLVGRERPMLDPLIEIGDKSFPSGHATAITSLWLALAIVVQLRTGGRSLPMWVLSAAIVALVAVSRPYLGVHYPSDVIAGVTLSAAWVLWCRQVLLPASPEE